MLVGTDGRPAYESRVDPAPESSPHGIGLRRRYLKTDKYLQLRAKRINKTEYKLTIKSDKALGAAQQTKTVKSESLNLEELKKSFAKISTSIKSKKEWKGDPQVLNLLDLAGNEYAASLLKSDTSEVEAEAQWLRAAEAYEATKIDA